MSALLIFLGILTLAINASEREDTRGRGPEVARSREDTRLAGDDSRAHLRILLASLFLRKVVTTHCLVWHPTTKIVKNHMQTSDKFFAVV